MSLDSRAVCFFLALDARSLTRSAGTLLPFREGRARWRARDESRATDDDEIQYASQL